MTTTMTIAEWIIVVILALALFTFLVVGIILAMRLIRLAEEARKIVETGQSIATKTDDIVDNVKGMTSVGGIVKTFANRVIEKQERRYAAEDAAERAAEVAAEEAVAAAVAEEAVKASKKKTSK